MQSPVRYRGFALRQVAPHRLWVSPRCALPACRARLMPSHETGLQPAGREHGPSGTVACPATACQWLASAVRASGCDQDWTPYMDYSIPWHGPPIARLCRLPIVSNCADAIGILDSTRSAKTFPVGRSAIPILTTGSQESQKLQFISEYSRLKRANCQAPIARQERPCADSDRFVRASRRGRRGRDVMAELYPSPRRAGKTRFGGNPFVAGCCAGRARFRGFENSLPELRLRALSGPPDSPFYRAITVCCCDVVGILAGLGEAACRQVGITRQVMLDYANPSHAWLVGLRGNPVRRAAPAWCRSAARPQYTVAASDRMALLWPVVWRSGNAGTRKNLMRISNWTKIFD
jgi:hypothetical protein